MPRIRLLKVKGDMPGSVRAVKPGHPKAPPNKLVKPHPNAKSSMSFRKVKGTGSYTPGSGYKGASKTGYTPHPVPTQWNAPKPTGKMKANAKAVTKAYKQAPVGKKASSKIRGARPPKV